MLEDGADPTDVTAKRPLFLNVVINGGGKSLNVLKCKKVTMPDC